MRGRYLLSLVATMSVLWFAAPVVLAQDSTSPGARVEPRASPALPPTHWAVEAARRAEALGLAENYLPAQRAVPRHVVGDVLREAALRAAEERPEVASIAQGWHERFIEEFPGLDASAEQVLPLIPYGSRARAGYHTYVGRDAPGLGEFESDPNRTGATPLGNRSLPFGAASLASGLGPHFAGLVELEAGSESPLLTGLDIIAGLGSVTFAIGRQPVGYGFGTGGAVVLSGASPLDRVQIETARPIELSGWLRSLGTMAFHTSLGLLHEDRHPGDPLLWTASGSLRPHSRFTLSVHRAAMIGGENAPGRITPGSVLLTIIGKHAGYEDQVVSAEFRYRAPTENFLPLTLYMEWGAEDSAGAFYKVPGRVFGFWIPALPGIPAVALGVERSHFEPSCCGNPKWYRHWQFPGNWTLGDRPLAHPLGGDGSEWLAHAQADLFEARVRLSGRAFQRERRSENLFVPGRQGESTGFSAGAAWRFVQRGEIAAQFSREVGDKWRERELHAGISVFFW